jgi:hypothetical protein
MTHPLRQAMTHTTTAATIIRNQIGYRALTMLGAHTLLAGKTYFQFHIRGSRKVNTIRIDLDPGDTYTVRFFRYRGIKVINVASVSDVYSDSLRTVIERHTGLYTSL